MKRNPRLLYQIAKETVALAGILELVLATYAGFLFGAGELSRGWLFTAILALIGYGSTKLWIWVMGNLNEKGRSSQGGRPG